MEPLKSETIESFQALLVESKGTKLEKTINLSKTSQTSTYIFVSTDGDDSFGLIIDQGQEDKLTLGQLTEQISIMLKSEAINIPTSYLKEVSWNKPIGYYKDSQPLYYGVGPAYDLTIKPESESTMPFCLRIPNYMLINEVYKIISEKVNQPCDSFVLQRRQLPPSLQTSEDKEIPRQLNPEKTNTIKITSLLQEPKELKVEKTDTIEDLKSRLEAEFQIPKAAQSLSFNNNKLEEIAKTLEEYGVGDEDSIQLTGLPVTKYSIGLIPKHSNGNIERLFNDRDELIILQKEGLKATLSKSINIKAITLSGKTIEIATSTDEPVKNISEKIHEKAGIIPSVQRLIYSGLTLNKEAFLFEYGIRDGATLHIVTRMRPDIEERAQFAGFLTEKEDNETATLIESGPAWRAANQGLLLEGICRNKICPAYNERVVMNYNFGETDVISAFKLTKCPECSAFIESPTIALNNCDYTFSGIKQNEDGTKERVCNQNWYASEGKYTKFEIPKGQWLTFTIYATNQAFMRAKLNPFCPLCNSPKQSEEKEKKLKCGHIYHEECSQKFKKKGCDICVLCHAE